MFCPHVNQSRLERVDGMASRECKMCDRHEKNTAHVCIRKKCYEWKFFMRGGRRCFFRNETKVPSTTTKFTALLNQNVTDRINLVAAKSVKFLVKYYRIYTALCIFDDAMTSSFVNIV